MERNKKDTGREKLNLFMNKYWKYFLYIIEHKINVGIECYKAKLFIHMITHDLSKFLPSEFIPYARFFYETNRYKDYNKKDESNINFQKGWLFHQKRNKHHWNYWISVTRKNEIIPIPMPEKYIKQMICDWKGMSRRFKDTSLDYYERNKENMILHQKTIDKVEELLKK